MSQHWCRCGRSQHDRGCVVIVDSARHTGVRALYRALVGSMAGLTAKDHPDRLDEPAMDLERQTQFCDIPWARKRAPGPLLDAAQPVTHGVGVTAKSFSGGPHRGVDLLPDPERLVQDFALLVG